MLGHHASVDIKQLAYGFLAQPYFMILHTNLYPLRFRVTGKDQKVRCSVA